MMQFPSFITKAATSHVSGSSYIPYGTIISDHVVKLSGGAGLLGTWRLDGIPFETVDESDILARKALHNFLRALGGGSFAVWTHKIVEWCMNGSGVWPTILSVESCQNDITGLSMRIGRWRPSCTSPSSTGLRSRRS